MPDTETLADAAQVVVETATSLAEGAHAVLDSATTATAEGAAQISDNATELASAVVRDHRARFVVTGLLVAVGATAVFVVIKRRRADAQAQAQADVVDKARTIV